MEARKAPARRSVVAVAAVLAACLSLAAAELVLRSISWRGPFRESERSLVYRHDELLGWFPRASTENEFTGSRTIKVRHNSRGFRDREHGPKQKKRILALGDSFVWGYDVEQNERFTERLQAKLKNWEVLNLGVSGFGTDQELLLLDSQIAFYQPEVVVLIVSDTDGWDNTRSMNYGGYYKPYFVYEGERLVPKGVPVPKSFQYYAAEYPGLFKSRVVRLIGFGLSKLLLPEPVEVRDPTGDLINNIKLVAKAKGAQLIVGATDKIARLPELCALIGVKYIDLQTSQRYTGRGNHWTPEGHEFVAGRIFEQLKF